MKLRTILYRLVAFALGLLLVVLQVLTQQTIVQALDSKPSDKSEISPSSKAEVRTEASPAVNPQAETYPNFQTTSPVSQPTSNPKAQDNNLESPEDPSEASKTKQEKEEETARLAKLAEADRLYKAGKLEEATTIYKQVKRPFTTKVDEKPIAMPIITDPEQLSPGGQVYWREAKEGFEQKMESRAIVAIDLLLKKHPEFLPGQILNAQIQDQYGKPDQSFKAIETLALRYPRNPDIQRLRLAALTKAERWLDASIAARQFALLYSTTPAMTEEFTTIADNNMDAYRKELRRKINSNVIGNVITGAIGTILTGGWIGPVTATQSAFSLIQGEVAIGKSIAKRAKNQLLMLEDKELQDYVSEIGQKLAKVAGRKDFDYEFNLVLDENINAFALPGGPVFVNLGAIAKTDSEAELAGLLGHEISHAALTHGLQLIAQGNFITSIVGYIPYAGGLVSDLFVFNYSRDMERQADNFGTRILVGAGYAADGLHSLMLKLQAEEIKHHRARPPVWLSSHPGSNERVANLEAVISTEGFDRYAYEGVDSHAPFKAKALKLIQTEKKKLKTTK